MILVDTGVLVALADRRGAHHRACVHWLLTELAGRGLPWRRDTNWRNRGTATRDPEPSATT